jgi:hypothetical protein
MRKSKKISISDGTGSHKITDYFRPDITTVTNNTNSFFNQPITTSTSSNVNPQNKRQEKQEQLTTFSNSELQDAFSEELNLIESEQPNENRVFKRLRRWDSSHLLDEKNLLESSNPQGHLIN